jgi:NAD(P)-dependent dehydrogenase (short-subunit alcohol dehydrogenase family)
MLFSVALADRFASRGLLSYSLHPGAIYTNLGNHLSEADIAELSKQSIHGPTIADIS